jgi:hypothetical protein
MICGFYTRGSNWGSVDTLTGKQSPMEMGMNKRMTDRKWPMLIEQEKCWILV